MLLLQTNISYVRESEARGVTRVIADSRNVRSEENNRPHVSIIQRRVEFNMICSLSDGASNI